MLYNKEAAIAAIAIMLVAAPFLGGFLLTPTFAQPMQVAEKTFEQGSDEETTIDSVSFEAIKESIRGSGDIIVRIVQGDEEVASTSISADVLNINSVIRLTVEFDDDVSVEDDFDVVIEYEGTGQISASGSSIEVNDDGETDTAEEEENGGTNTAGGSSSSSVEDLEMENEIERKTISLASNEKMDVETVEFEAIEEFLRTSGTITVAIVQGNNVLDTDEISTDQTNPNTAVDLEADFDLEVTGSFDVVILFDGSGTVSVGNINVPGSTSPAADPDSGGSGGSETQTDSSPNVVLTIEAEDEDSNALEMFMTVYQGFDIVDTGYTPVTFDLPDGNYTVQAHNFEDTTFLRWDDSSQGAFRFADLRNFDSETFTAIYSVPDDGTDTSGTDGTDTGTGGTDTGGSDTGGSDTGTGGTGGSNPTGTEGVLTVNTILLNGSPVSGFQTQLRDSTGTPVATEFSPATFDEMADGENYRVVMYSAANSYFRNWENNGLHRYHSATSADEGKVFTAKYENVPADQAAHLVVMAKTSDGTIIGGTTGSDTDGTLSAESGLEVLVAPPGTLTPYTAGFTGGSEISEHFYFAKGGTYTIVVQEFAPYTFSHWEDNGSTSRSRAVPLNGDTTLVAIYNVS